MEGGEQATLQRRRVTATEASKATPASPKRQRNASRSPRDMLHVPPQIFTMARSRLPLASIKKESSLPSPQSKAELESPKDSKMPIEVRETCLQKSPQNTNKPKETQDTIAIGLRERSEMMVTGHQP